MEGCCLQGHATSDHTTLLLNCYSKLKDIQKLEAFLRRTGATGDNATLQFDTEVAVKVHTVQCQLLHIAMQWHSGHHPGWTLGCVSCSLWQTAPRLPSGSLTIMLTRCTSRPAHPGPYQPDPRASSRCA